MKLTVLGSSSSGNCYLLESKKEVLILEAGVNLKEIKRAVKAWPVIAGCLLTHEHGDHSKSAIGLMRLGVNVYASPGTFKALKVVKHVHRDKAIQSKIWYQVGSFRVFPFDLEHDAAQHLGFTIFHPEMGTLVFITDTHYCNYLFPKINNLIIECNYSDEILQKNIDAGRIQDIVRKRLLTNHMSLETCKGFLRANDLTGVQNIVLCHLSDGNSNARQFKKEIKELTNKNVFIASKGLKIELNLNPF